MDLLAAFISRRHEALRRRDKLLAVVLDTSRDSDERHACHVLAYKINVALEQRPTKSKRIPS